MTKDELLELMATPRAEQGLAEILEELGSNDMTGEECAYVVARMFGAIVTGMISKYGDEASELLGEIAKIGAVEAADAIQDLADVRNRESN